MRIILFIAILLTPACATKKVELKGLRVIPESGNFDWNEGRERFCIMDLDGLTHCWQPERLGLET